MSRRDDCQGQRLLRNVSKFDPVDLSASISTPTAASVLEVLDQVASAGTGPRAHTRVRLSVLPAAAAFAAGKAVAGIHIKSADVLKIVEAWERSVLTNEG